MEGSSHHRSYVGEANPNYKSGRTFHPLYHIWTEMIRRCEYENHMRYSDYGGRGITVCDEWKNDFWKFVSDVGDRPEGMTGKRPLYSLDRIDNDLGYCPENVKWSTLTEQAKNRRVPRRNKKIASSS